MISGQSGRLKGRLWPFVAKSFWTPIPRLPLEVLNSTRLLCIAYYELSDDTAADSAALVLRRHYKMSCEDGRIYWNGQLDWDFHIFQSVREDIPFRMSGLASSIFH